MYDTSFHGEKKINEYCFLVTGGAGFIGSHLVAYLLQHGAKKVRILDNFSTGFAHNLHFGQVYNNLEIIEGDIRNINDCQRACTDIDFVLHEAALGSVPRSMQDPITTNEVNITGFLNMLVAARDNKVQRFVYAASSSTYGDSPILPKVEEQIGKPLSPYAVTKYVNELYADVFYKTYGLETIGLRYFNVFGPRQNPKGAYAAVIPLFIQDAFEGKSPKIYGNGEQTRDFTFVENVVQANIKAIFVKEAAAINQVYNVACGTNITINQLFGLIKKHTQSTSQTIHVENRKGDIQDSLADIAKAQNLLNYQPSIFLEEGLKITIETFQKQVNEKAY